MDPDHLDSIREYQHPKTNKELQRWLGMYMWLGQFTFSPLKDRLPLRKNYSNELQWNQEQAMELETARSLIQLLPNAATL